MRPSISGVLDSLAGSIQDRRATSADYHPRQPPAPRAGRPEGWGGGMPGTGGGVCVWGYTPLLGAANFSRRVRFVGHQHQGRHRAERPVAACSGRPGCIKGTRRLRPRTRPGGRVLMQRLRMSNPPSLAKSYRGVISQPGIAGRESPERNRCHPATSTCALHPCQRSRDYWAGGGGASGCGVKFQYYPFPRETTISGTPTG
jgi:hypothetical protein